MENPEQMFAAETLDDLQQFLSLCLELQKNPDKNISKEILRIMHSIKGNAQIVNFQEIVRLVHACEEVLETSIGQDFRDHEQASELILQAHDSLVEWCNKLKANTTLKVDFFAELTNKLKAHLKSQSSAKSNQKVDVVKDLPKKGGVVKKVLVVDDDRDFIAVLQDAIEAFSNAGITTEVEVCYNGFEAISLSLKNRYDLIVTDLKMPVLDGIEFIKGLRKIEHNKGTPILFISGFFSTVSASDHKELMENVVFIEKPFNLGKFRNYINMFFLSQEIENKKQA